MELPFTPEQFFDVFAAYNDRFAIVVIVLWLVSFGLLFATWRRPQSFSRGLTIWISVLWWWNAIAYHAMLFTTINPAAWLFAGIFVIEGALLFWAAMRDRILYSPVSYTRRIIGVSLSIYALAYPWLTIAAGHRYPSTPTFGVPCPTDILTIGLLMMVRGGVPLKLAVIPIIWGLIGGSAAIVLAVVTDYMLLAAALVLLVSLAARQS